MSETEPLVVPLPRHPRNLHRGQHFRVDAPPGRTVSVQDADGKEVATFDGGETGKTVRFEASVITTPPKRPGALTAPQPFVSAWTRLED